MKNRFIPANKTNLKSRDRINDINILLPKIRAEFYVRLNSLLQTDPEISEEGYEFFIKDTKTGKEFSAGLTGFGPGYFATENSDEMIEQISNFHNYLFNDFSELKDCKIEIEHDFGKSIFGFENGKFIEIDLEE